VFDPNPTMAFDSAIVAPRPAPACRLVDWKPWHKPNPSLLGHATVAFSGWTIHAVPVFRGRDGSLSAGGPSAPILDADGRQKVDGAGKKQYQAIVTFEGNGRDIWTRAVLGALAAAGIDPGAGEGQS
jgi:hypothetical protein